jgi:hypothetical protein
MASIFDSVERSMAVDPTNNNLASVAFSLATKFSNCMSSRTIVNGKKRRGGYVYMLKVAAVTNIVFSAVIVAPLYCLYCCTRSDNSENP